MNRITFSLEAPSHVDELQSVTIATVEELLCKLTESTGIAAANCSIMIVSGNTTMIHFLLKLNAWMFFASPFAPVSSDPGFSGAVSLGWNLTV